MLVLIRNRSLEYYQEQGDKVYLNDVIEHNEIFELEI